MRRLAPAAALALAACAAAPEAERRPPNIVLIMADDVGVEGFGCYGGTSYRTPSIDRLAAEGVRFARCHAQPLCTPSRVKIMTGLGNARNYRAFSVLDRGERTFAHVLREAGYATAAVGKWQLLGAEHYDEPVRGAGARPDEAGFDRWCLWQVEALGSRYWGPTLTRDGATSTLGDDVYGPDECCRFALDFITDHRDRPFLLYYPMALPHGPFVPPPGAAGDRRRGDPAQFGAMVEHLDAIVGRIVAHLDELGLREDTLVLFTADNGTHRRIRSRLGAREVRGGKGRTTDAGTHVPLLARWPGTALAGHVCDDLVDFADVLPTLAEVAGAPVGGPVDGRSLAPQLRGEPGDPDRVLTCFYHPRPLSRPRSRAVRFARDRRFKLYGDGRLFDLDADPGEERPVEHGALDAAATVRLDALRAALAAMPEPAVLGRVR